MLLYGMVQVQWVRECAVCSVRMCRVCSVRMCRVCSVRMCGVHCCVKMHKLSCEPDAQHVDYMDTVLLLFWS